MFKGLTENSAMALPHSNNLRNADIFAVNRIFGIYTDGEKTGFDFMIHNLLVVFC